MKMKKRSLMLILTMVTVVIAAVVVSLNLYEPEENPHKKYIWGSRITGYLVKPVFYLGENENWRCEYRISTGPDPYSGVYHNDLKIRYKHDDMDETNFYARLMHGIATLNIVEDTGFKSEIHAGGGSKGMRVITHPLKVYISLNSGEEECIELHKVD